MSYKTIFSTTTKSAGPCSNPTGTHNNRSPSMPWNKISVVRLRGGHTYYSERAHNLWLLCKHNIIVIYHYGRIDGFLCASEFCGQPSAGSDTTRGRGDAMDRKLTGNVRLANSVAEIPSTKDWPVTFLLMYLVIETLCVYVCMQKRRGGKFESQRNRVKIPNAYVLVLSLTLYIHNTTPRTCNAFLT